MTHQDDINEALADVQAIHSPQQSAQKDMHAAEGGAVALAPPDKKYVFGSLLWGIGSAWRKVFAVAKRHPWYAVLTLGASVACAQFACVYFGFTVLAGMMIWAMKLES